MKQLIIGFFLIAGLAITSAQACPIPEKITIPDFAHLLPGEAKAKIGARILMSPISARLLHRALGENLARYEAAYGTIQIPLNTTLADNLFRPHQPPPEPPTESPEEE